MRSRHPDQPCWAPWLRHAAIAALAACVAVLPSAQAQCTDRAAFVANNGNLEGSVTAFTVHTDGTLNYVNKVVTGSRPHLQVPCPGCNPYEIAITPNGRYLATGHASTNDAYEQVSLFEVAASGVITQVGAFSILGTPMDVVWLSDEFLAVTRTDPSPNQVVVYRWAPSPPALTPVDAKNVGTFSTYLAVHPSREYLYVNDSGSGRLLRTFHVAANGVLTEIDSDSTGSYYALELAVAHDGTRLYGAGGITHVVMGFDVAVDGTLAPLAGSPFPEFGSSPSNVAISSDDAYLLAGHGTDATVRSAAIDPETGALTSTGYMFDVGLQGTLGDVQTLDELFFVTDNSTAIDGVMGLYSFTLNADGSFTPNAGIYDTQGIAPRSVATWKPLPPLGDLNCDLVVDFDDINPFVLALSDPAGYASEYPNCNIWNADINGDGLINFDDVNAFVDLLAG